jgi:hypothetical protein
MRQIRATSSSSSRTVVREGDVIVEPYVMCERVYVSSVCGKFQLNRRFLSDTHSFVISAF